jgi:DNA-directed RNA polymerase specialized sigma24 family protein
MSAIYYVIDPNGNIYSEDKQSRFTALRGASLDAFIKSEEAKKRYFTRTRDEKDNLICVEIPQDKVSEYEAQRLHSLYLSKYEEDYQILSLDAPISEDESEPLVNQIPDDDAEWMDEVLKEEIRAAARRAIKSLSPDELRVVYKMFFGDVELSERQVAAILEIPPKTVHNRKIRAFKKIRDFLKK